MDTNTVRVDETCLNDFQPGYLETFVEYHARKFRWNMVFTQRVLRDAIRFLKLSSLPPTGQEHRTEAQVMVSSPLVDKIVDAIFLDTPLLIWLERNVFATRMLHVPSYAHQEATAAINNLRYEFTVRMMWAAGYPVDDALWPQRLPSNYATCTCGNDLDDCKVMPYRES